MIDPKRIQPTEFRVLVQLDPVEEITKGGIVLPSQTKERNQAKELFATVLKVGGNAFQDWAAPVPKVGDRVMIAKYSGERPPIDESLTYAIVNDKDVIAVIEKD